MKLTRDEYVENRSKHIEENMENRKDTIGKLDAQIFRIGSRVERELDGLWFPATIVDIDRLSGTFEIEYDEDHNRETAITKDELRLYDEEHLKDSSYHHSPKKPELTARQKEMLKDSLLLQISDYDPNKAPNVILHHKGETHAASGYIVNGLENNIAAGNGLQGIRWLRMNTC